MAPKAQIKQAKKDKVEKVTNALKEAKSVVFVDYSGMNVKLQENLRDKLRETGGSVAIVKNTLIKIAAEAAKLPEESLDDTVLSGQTALIMSSSDAVAPIQVLGKFIKTTEFPKIKAGVVEGIFQNADGIIKITKLPSKEVLTAQVVGAIASPMYGLVGTLQGNLNKLVWLLKAKATA